jgi:hypothetical protein
MNQENSIIIIRISVEIRRFCHSSSKLIPAVLREQQTYLVHVIWKPGLAFRVDRAGVPLVVEALQLNE